MKAKSLFALFFIMIFIVTAALAMEDKTKGAHQLEIFGGSRGKVPFPHHTHQDNLKNCDTCHSVFPKTPESIKDLKDKGKLKKKHVMKKLCINCHKAQKRAGNKSGPTTCSKCHVR